MEGVGGLLKLWDRERETLWTDTIVKKRVVSLGMIFQGAVVVVEWDQLGTSRGCEQSSSRARTAIFVSLPMLSQAYSKARARVNCDSRAFASTKGLCSSYQ